MTVEYSEPPEGYREEPARVPGEDECSWKEKTMGEGYADDIDNAHPLPERE